MFSVSPGNGRTFSILISITVGLTGILNAKGQTGMEDLEIAFKMHKGAEQGKEGDSFLYRDNLFMVAEGVGGEYVSEIAQERACRIIPESFFKHLSEVQSPGHAIIHALREANEGILSERNKLGRKMAASA